MNRLIRIALTFLLVMTSGVIQAEIVIYPVPQGIYYARHNDDYTVKVRQVGEKDWVDLYEYNVKVDMDTKSDATMVQFDFSGKVAAPALYLQQIIFIGIVLKLRLCHQCTVLLADFPELYLSVV